MTRSKSIGLLVGAVLLVLVAGLGYAVFFMPVATCPHWKCLFDRQFATEVNPLCPICGGSGRVTYWKKWQPGSDGIQRY